MIVMKKTLITLALAATVASGSAMAWTANGTGGHVQLSGTLSHIMKVTPWEVKVGAALTGLDAEIQNNQMEVKIAVDKAIPILGIRTKESSTFKGSAGISPQIDFDGAVDLDGFTEGVTILTLPIKGANGAVIGSLNAPFSAAAVMSYKMTIGTGSVSSMHASQGGNGFFGGLAKSPQYKEHSLEPQTKALALWPDITEHFNWQGESNFDRASSDNFNSISLNYSGYYASGIESGREIKISLTSPILPDGPLTWNASLPVTVTYI